MRTRTTWQNKSDETPRQAATQRKADIYTMNQDHPQPGVTDYESGSPDSWAEGVVTGDKMSVNDEYEGGHVKRNEVGFPEFRDDTWKHKDSDKWNDGKKYDNAKLAAERKAVAAERVARALLRTNNEKLVEETAVELMALSPKSLVATLKRIEMVSPDSLSDEAKYKRAYACTKLAASVLGESAREDHVERLASHFMSIDDPTLKSILKTVAAARVAQEQEQEEAASVAQEQEEEEEETAPVAQDTQSQEECMSQEQVGLSAEEMAMLDGLLHEEGCPAPAPVPPTGGSLVELFEAAPAPAPTAPMAPMMASNLDISFDEEDEAEPTDAVANVASLDDLFADDPEVVAQRQIASANAEALGFSRTASAKGAKKLGQVKATPAKAEIDKLEAIWERY